ncbi:hypothetical protein TNCV_3589641 [Trichonephila clavipes]|nr:hypothetical protein TNCV_3589641 [Trichonephila clavipes]
MPAGWRNGFDPGLIRPRLRVRPRSKSVDFHDAINRQGLCRMIILHVKDLSSALGKTKIPCSVSHRQSSDAFLWEGT